MKVLLRRIAATASFLVLTLPLWAQNPNNPIQLALLRWYQSDTAAQIQMESTCISPQNMAFDGSHIWVACSGSKELDEFNTSDGAFVQKVSLTFDPGYLLYDGANMWVANPSAGTITEVEASTGAVLGTVTVGTTPSGMAFDGTHIWVANAGSNTLSEVTAATRTVAGTFNVSSSAGCQSPTTVAFITSQPGTPANGSLAQSLCVVCNAQPPQIAEFTSAGAFVAATGTNVIGGDPNCNNVAFDGRYIWLPTVSGPSGTASGVLKLDTTNLTVVKGFNIPSPISVAYDGAYVWVAGSDGFVTKVVVSTSTLGQRFSTGFGAAFFAAFDGGYVWVSTPGEHHNMYTVSKM
jgi:hypothetical protein